MNIVSIILSSAKLVGISGTLLLAICSHESLNFKLNYNAKDGGSPSMGVCQLKKATADFLGYKGTEKDLKNNAVINSYYAAKYLKYQETRSDDPKGGYGPDNWMKLTAAYNSGQYIPSTRFPGCPQNHKYLKLVQAKLPEKYKYKLNCGK